MNVADTSARTQAFTETQRRVKIPVAVVLQRHIEAGKKWAFPEWSVCSVITANQGNSFKQHITVLGDGATHRYYWSGLSLDLYKDGSEGYWYNLLSETPYLFVVCNGSIGDMEIEPRYITANQDEASGHLESDDLVLPIPMPVSVRDLLERYVITHYRPVKKKKRKRRDWLEDSLYVKKD